MTIPLPAGLFGNNAYFYANNSFTLGSMSKPVNAKTLVSIDYSTLPTQPVVPTAYWFEVDVGSQPPLTISNPLIVGEVLTFIVSYGVPGVSYTLNVTITYGEQVRTDTILIEVPAEGGCCGTTGLALPIPGAPVSLPSHNNIAGFLTGEGVVFLNSGPRYFVSAIAPGSACILDQWYNTTTRVLSELITDGLNLIWMPFNQVPRTALEGVFTEALTVTAPNTLSPLTRPYDGNLIKVLVNGQAFFPLGLVPDFHMSGQNVIWTSGTYSINTDDIVVAEYSTAIVAAGGFVMEQLGITILNTFPLLAHNPGTFMELTINGRTFNPVGGSPPFSVTGNAITWLSIIYNVVPGANVIACYSY